MSRHDEAVDSLIEEVKRKARLNYRQNLDPEEHSLDYVVGFKVRPESGVVESSEDSFRPVGLEEEALYIENMRNARTT